MLERNNKTQSQQKHKYLSDAAESGRAAFCLVNFPSVYSREDLKLGGLVVLPVTLTLPSHVTLEGSLL